MKVKGRYSRYMFFKKLYKKMKTAWDNDEEIIIEIY